MLKALGCCFPDSDRDHSMDGGKRSRLYTHPACTHTQLAHTPSLHIHPARTHTQPAHTPSLYTHPVRRAPVKGQPEDPPQGSELVCIPPGPQCLHLGEETQMHRAGLSSHRTPKTRDKPLPSKKKPLSLPTRKPLFQFFLSL